ncbi:MAG TPA: (deoxy)nucleoside triphosphate pyrophosphohydrolase [Polyangia bacterium]
MSPPPTANDPPRTLTPSQIGERRRLLVVAALIEREGRILLSKRRPDQALPNCWEFPGGKVEPGEDPVVALEREIDEELGCRARVGHIFEVVFHAYPVFDLVMLVYRAEITAGTPSARQVAQVAWYTPAEIPNLDLPPADVPLARRLADGELGRR